jgi:5-methylcytosine-specific restriction endonuclease McrA
MGKRKEALIRGDKKYISDVACKHCGSFEKYTSGYKCVPCSIKEGREKLNNAELMAPYRTKEKQKKKLQNWRKNNYDKYQQQWLNDEAKVKSADRQGRRRARVRNQIPNDADFDAIKTIYQRCRQMCEETGIEYEVDHIIPIAKGGFHHQDNLQIITKSENRSKGCRIDGEDSTFDRHTCRNTQ